MSGPPEIVRERRRQAVRQAGIEDAKAAAKGGEREAARGILLVCRDRNRRTTPGGGWMRCAASRWWDRQAVMRQAGCVRAGSVASVLGHGSRGAAAAPMMSLAASSTGISSPY